MITIFSEKDMKLINTVCVHNVGFSNVKRNARYNSHFQGLTLRKCAHVRHLHETSWDPAAEVACQQNAAHEITCAILQSQVRGSPNLKGQVPVCISFRNRVAQFYTQVLGSLFVAPYDS
jgi:hypothetical protein